MFAPVDLEVYVASLYLSCEGYATGWKHFSQSQKWIMCFKTTNVTSLYSSSPDGMGFAVEDKAWKYLNLHVVRSFSDAQMKESQSLSITLT